MKTGTGNLQLSFFSKRHFCYLNLLALILLTGTSTLTAANSRKTDAPTITLIPIELEDAFSDVIAPNSLQLACARRVGQLEEFFANAQLPFSRELIRSNTNSGDCHIYYEPTVKGFRADPDNLPVSELFVDIDTTSFLAKRDQVLGDTLDVVKEIARSVPRPIRIQLGINQHNDRHWIDSALAYHFPDTIHDISTRNSKSDVSIPWAQDYLKSGLAGTERRLLVTRRLIENNIDQAPSFEPMLSSFSEAQFVRSKLSWEGGDLQFVRSPLDSSRTILFYGSSAKSYWGTALSDEEYRYVLQLEFGSDEAIDFTDLVSHVDYFVSFLPEDNIALVSKPELGNLDLAKDSLRLLKQRFPVSHGWEHLDFEALRKMTSQEFRKQKYDLRDKLKEAAEASWPILPEAGLLEEMEAYIQQECPNRPEDCMDHEGRSLMLEKDIELLERWISAGLKATAEQKLPGRLLSIVETQLPNFKPMNLKAIDKKVDILRDLGFRVIFVPRIAGDPNLTTAWAGISYTNSLLIDKMLFIPRFGLGSAEDEMFERVQAQLPDGYQLIPVYARRTLLFNGGIHCLFGIVRSNLNDAPSGNS
ncbi:MAG: agmatine deiminase family protein [Acidobacteriota bacterium]|nr:MAG: agmatine deiminase family protein [Acidobacteriota bacterium]